jgi:hypothetical protein
MSPRRITDLARAALVRVPRSPSMLVRPRCGIRGGFRRSGRVG